MCSWIISLLVLVQRCPAVPTAPNTAPMMVIFKSASGVTMIALFPPSSKSVLPRRCATVTATSFPMRVDPVAEIKAMRLSAESHSPTSLSPIMRLDIPSGSPLLCRISASNFWQAMAHSGVFSLGFQTTVLPQTRARAVFHAHTATGKLNAVIIPTTPKG
ncbi:hypothetical protein D3C72_1741690 [compost metagenome]